MLISKKIVAFAIFGVAGVIISNADRSAKHLSAAAPATLTASLITGFNADGGQPSVPARINSVPWATDLNVTDKGNTRSLDTPAEVDEMLFPSRRKPSPQELARSLQRELKRVGCYGDEITPEWTGTARRAMRAFNAKVNATLPVDVPDHILLTLVSGHHGRACDRPCSTSSKGGDCAAVKASAEHALQSGSRVESAAANVD